MEQAIVTRSLYRNFFVARPLPGAAVIAAHAGAVGETVASVTFTLDMRTGRWVDPYLGSWRPNPQRRARHAGSGAET